jgi:dolichyl-phosphate beta-glucosyltransferase
VNASPSPFALTIVVPAYNEAERLPASLAAIVDYLAEAPDLRPAEIVVVDDGSHDDTRARAASAPAAAGVEIRVTGFGSNRGKGAAIRAGLEASAGARVLLCDADLATPIGELRALLAVRADVAAGSRAVRRELIERHQPAARDLLGRLFNLALRLLGLTRFLDTQCGFKLLDGDLARRIAPRLRLDRFAFDVELLARAERLGATVVEVAVRWRHVDSSRVRPLRDGLRMALDALRLRWWLWTGG